MNINTDQTFNHWQEHTCVKYCQNVMLDVIIIIKFTNDFYTTQF